jgi:ribulose-bisphosphate carboxylase large chain
VIRVGGAGGLAISGERFIVVYRLAGTEEEARRVAGDICVEQTVEFPEDLIEPGPIRDAVMGKLLSLRTLEGEGACEAVISFAAEITGFELTQLLNVVYGNISIKRGIRVERIELSENLAEAFRGPRFGRDLRELTSAEGRPLLCAALKPMGLSPAELAALARDFALGGIDIVKDDHGLANQRFCPFEERVLRCAGAIAEANAARGGRCLYFPNVTADLPALYERARFAKDAGAGGLVISPGLTGLDAMRQLAADDVLGLPVLYHPAFQGSFVASRESGLSHAALFGQIARMCGADGSIFPNTGGRFSFSLEECREIADATAAPMGKIRTSFPCPGGGMTLERIPGMLGLYGTEAVFLIGGGLFRLGPDLVDNCRRVVEAVGTPAHAV